MNVEFINPFLSSLINVLSTMAQTQLKPGKPRIKTDEIACGDVSGLIGMVGPQTRGSFSITFDEGLALTIMERMLGERPDTIDEEVTDMVGEITNMVTGGAKNLLGEKGVKRLSCHLAVTLVMQTLKLASINYELAAKANYIKTSPARFSYN